MNFNEESKYRTEYIEKVLDEYLPKEEEMQKIIMQAMSYSVKAGGKRLRPMLMLETMKLFVSDTKKAKPFMAAIEMIHTYSLVHDDLPAMDNDKYRRGRKTTWLVYGDDIGVLAGDALLNYAFEIMSAAVIKSENIKQAAEAMNIIAKKSGIYGMIGGQTVDVINNGKIIDLNTINYIHKLKTAALIEASMMTGAVLGGADDGTIKIIEHAASDIGLAFQIQDDILDVSGDEKVLGKPVHSDEKNSKTTYVSIKGMKQAAYDVENLSREALDILSSVGNNEFLEELITKLIYREK